MSEGYHDKDSNYKKHPTGGDFDDFAHLAPNLQTMCIHWHLFIEQQGRRTSVPRPVPSSRFKIEESGHVQITSTLKEVKLKVVDNNWVPVGDGAVVANRQLRDLVLLVQSPHLKEFSLAFESTSLLDEGNRSRCISSVTQACNEGQAVGLKKVALNLSLTMRTKTQTVDIYVSLLFS